MDLSDISVVPEPSAKQLNQRQISDYESDREDCLRWLLAFGKDPEKADGYAKTTVAARFHRIDQFYRWVWEQEDRYTTEVTREHADEWMQELAYADYSDYHEAESKPVGGTKVWYAGSTERCSTTEEGPRTVSLLEIEDGKIRRGE